jgi:hypothetical protein
VGRAGSVTDHAGEVGEARRRRRRRAGGPRARGRGDQLEAQLARQGKRQDLEPGVATRVDKVDCPDDADTSEGAMFRCDAIGPGGKTVGTVTVQMRADGDARWQFVAAAPS